MKSSDAGQLLIGILLISSFTSISAQSLFPVSLAEKIDHSSLIIEGKVSNSISFWNPAHTMIYTSSSVLVTKIFKGNIITENVEVVTDGGSVGNYAMQASDLLQLENNETGIFMCIPDRKGLRSPMTGNKLYEVYGSAQGFLKYNIKDRSAHAPFANYSSIERELIPRIEKKLGRASKVIRSGIIADPGKTILSSPSGVLSPSALSITSFLPTTVNAGALMDPANNLLTINGSGFGDIPSGTCAVLFDDADDGPDGNFTGIPYNSPLVVSWNNTQIQVRVPTKAGTGLIAVRDTAGTIISSSSNLTVRFSIMTGNFGANGIKEIHLVDADGLGGYSILYSTNTANSGVDLDTSVAKATFQRALTTWKEIAGFNVTEAGTTTTQVIDPNDPENVIMFDNSGTGTSPLPAGVLAVCYSSFGICPDDPVNNQGVKIGFDIVIRNAGFSAGSTNFTIGPCPPLSSSSSEVDLETVLLHELGHALGLGHINDPWEGSVAGEVNPNKLMNYAVVNSVKRNTPDYSAKAGADYLVPPKGLSLGAGCGLFEMTQLATMSELNDECPGSFPATATPPNTIVSFDLDHATSNKYVDPSYTQVLTSGTGTGITNNAYYAFKTRATGGSLNLTVTGYTITPAAQGSCTMAYSYPVKGVGLSLYQVSSCPLAQSYPTPIAYRSFSSNGSIPAITGLSANTTYLVMLDGIENTKAAFSLTFNGSALPLSLTDFSGSVQSDYNLLNWKFDNAYDIRSLEIEKSADGIGFVHMSDISYSINTHKGSIRDVQPFGEENYYRLAIRDIDGSLTYSKVILLKRSDAIRVTAYPNPASDYILLQISGSMKGKYTIILQNASGQTLLSKQEAFTGRRSVSRIPLKSYSAGSYQIILLDEGMKLIKTIKISINDNSRH